MANGLRLIALRYMWVLISHVLGRGSIAYPITFTLLVRHLWQPTACQMKKVGTVSSSICVPNMDFLWPSFGTRCGREPLDPDAIVEYEPERLKSSRIRRMARVCLCPNVFLVASGTYLGTCLTGTLDKPGFFPFHFHRYDRFTSIYSTHVLYTTCGITYLHIEVHIFMP